MRRKMFWISGLILVFSLACSEKKNSEARREVNDQESDQRSLSEQFPLPRRNLRQTKIYIDSVPAGAKVYLQQREEGSRVKDRLLGKTPLRLDSSECSGMTFWIRMDMGEYIKKVAAIPEMEKWIKNFKSDRYFGEPNMGFQRYFNFEGSLSQVVSSPTGGLVAVGPVYKLDWPNHNRICVLFVPKEKALSIFYPLMPPAGTFTRPKGRWESVLRDEYRFSEEQIKEALECLTRCGKYRTRIKDPFKKDIVREYSIVTQGPGNDLIVTAISEIKIIPGHNDTLFGY